MKGENRFGLGFSKAPELHIPNIPWANTYSEAFYFPHLEVFCLLPLRFPLLTDTTFPAWFFERPALAPQRKRPNPIAAKGLETSACFPSQGPESFYLSIT